VAILAVNAGSSSIKLSLIADDDESSPRKSWLPRALASTRGSYGRPSTRLSAERKPSSTASSTAASDFWDRC
jgi:acetate kinase